MSQTAVGPKSSQPYLAELSRWRADYRSRLAAPHGWWSLTNLSWLEPGENLLGSAPEARLPLPSHLPPRVALLDLGPGGVTITPLVGGLRANDQPLDGPITTASDLDLYTGSAPEAAKVNLIRRKELYGVRTYDPVTARANDAILDVSWFEPNEALIFDAEFLPPAAGEVIDVSNVLGQVSPQPVAGRLAFEFAGRSHSVVATAASGGRLFVNFCDATNGGAKGAQAAIGAAKTYGGGRFLYPAGPVDGRVRLDFNFAHHPPCAHTPYAVCPMPVAENRLPFAVAAGERYG